MVRENLVDGGDGFDAPIFAHDFRTLWVSHQHRGNLELIPKLPDDSEEELRAPTAADNGKASHDGMKIASFLWARDITTWRIRSSLRE